MEQDRSSAFSHADALRVTRLRKPHDSAVATLSLVTKEMELNAGTYVSFYCKSFPLTHTQHR